MRFSPAADAVPSSSIADAFPFSSAIGFPTTATPTTAYSSADGVTTGAATTDAARSAGAFHLSSVGAFLSSSQCGHTTVAPTTSDATATGASGTDGPTASALISLDVKESFSMAE